VIPATRFRTIASLSLRTKCPPIELSRMALEAALWEFIAGRIPFNAARWTCLKCGHQGVTHYLSLDTRIDAVVRSHRQSTMAKCFFDRNEVLLKDVTSVSNVGCQSKSVAA
jgi:hypothetical protein